MRSLLHQRLQAAVPYYMGISSTPRLLIPDHPCVAHITTQGMFEVERPLRRVLARMLPTFG